MKKFTCILLASLLMTACGAKETAEPAAVPAESAAPAENSAPVEGATASQEEQINIVVYNMGAAADEQLTSNTYARFMEDNPNVHVENNFVVSNTWSDYINKLLASIAAGDPPDMLKMAIEGAAQCVDSDLVLPLDSYLGEAEDAGLLEDIHPDLINALEIGDVPYFMPTEWNGILIYYNKDLFDAAGIPYPDGTWNLTEFREICAQLSSGEGEDRVYGFGIPPYSIFVNMFPYANGGRTVSEDLLSPQMNDPKVIEAFQYINDMIHVDQSVPIPEAEQDYNQLFANGRVAMVPFGHSSITAIRSAGFENWDVAYPPKEDDGSSIMGLAGYGILKSTPNPDVCWDVIMALAGEETMAEVATAGVSNPVSRSVAWSDAALEFPANAKIFYGMLDEGSTVLPAPICDTAYEEILGRYYNDMMSTGQDVTALCEAAQAEMEPVFAEIGQ